LLLLDDIYDKLDEKRVKQLMNLVSSNHFGQVFITDTHADRIPAIFDGDVKIYYKQFDIKNGGVKIKHLIEEVK
ncbi:MAG: DNA replication and repair protein RecF, partial [Bacteroidia bacterium]|nr:DNA replication and repair protein RecF [Bacteroidia bacterium]